MKNRNFTKVAETIHAIYIQGHMIIKNLELGTLHCNTCNKLIEHPLPKGHDIWKSIDKHLDLKGV